MASLNKVILIGNLGADPEVKYIQDDTPVANFSIATHENFKDRNGEKKEITEWHSIVAWRGLAKVIESYVKKGDRVYIEGKIRTRSWDDKDGNKRYKTEVLADNLIMLGGGKGGNNESAPKMESASSDDATSQDDDLPF
jgi:single-strand DNA-binding protein